MHATMDDVDEMRELAAESCGVITRWAEDALREDDYEQARRLVDCSWGGTIVQHARDLEAWVTLRMRVEELSVHMDFDCVSHSAIGMVLAIMDELEGP